MRRSFSVTLEPGLERGIPWSHDLHTFVTSAAGHMMRTLQKPRKCRPSKRKVNHRRFLHNMIQRQFADIEASNHRLISALYLNEDGKNTSSQESATCDELGGSSHSDYLKGTGNFSFHMTAGGVTNSRNSACLGSRETKDNERSQSELGHLWKWQPKCQSTICTARKNNQGEELQREKGKTNHKRLEVAATDCLHTAELCHTLTYDDDNLLKPGNISEDTLKVNNPTMKDSGPSFAHLIEKLDISPPFSLELFPLSLNSCEVPSQMLSDVSLCTQSFSDIAESQWTDVVDFFKDIGDSADVEACFESICAGQRDGGAESGGTAEGRVRGELAAENVALTSFSDCLPEKICSDRSELEDLHLHNGYSCHGNEELSTNHFHSDQWSSQAPFMRQSENAGQIQTKTFQASQSKDLIQNHLPSFTDFHYEVSQLLPQERRLCTVVNCENAQNFVAFEGVAQSFSAPLYNPENRFIPTPSREEDWLCTDILTDTESPHC